MSVADISERMTSAALSYGATFPKPKDARRMARVFAAAAVAEVQAEALTSRAESKSKGPAGMSLDDAALRADGNAR